MGIAPKADHVMCSVLASLYFAQVFSSVFIGVVPVFSPSMAMFATEDSNTGTRALGAGTFDGEAKFKCRRRNHHLLTFVYQIYHGIANISKYCKYIRIMPDVS